MDEFSQCASQFKNEVVLIYWAQYLGHDEEFFYRKRKKSDYKPL